MKILKQGFNPSTWSVTHLCWICQSELEVEANDVKSASRELDDYRGESYNEVYFYFNCPVCNSKIEIKLEPQSPIRKWIEHGRKFPINN
jgi:DNA-directed RNA polymerase subunit RPC12/RpoP